MTRLHTLIVGGDGGPREVAVGVLPSPAMAAPKNPRGGRPAKQGGPATPYTIKLSEERRMRWEALARLRDVDLSDLVRESTDAACEAAGILPVPDAVGPEEEVRPGPRADELDAAAARGEGVFVLRRKLESFDLDAPGPAVLAARTLAVALALAEGSGAPGEASAWRVGWRPVR